MTTIHVSQADQMQATVLVQHHLPFLKEQKNVSQPSVWCTNSTASVRLLMECPSYGPSEKTFHLNTGMEGRYVFSCNPGLLEYMHVWF